MKEEGKKYIHQATEVKEFNDKLQSVGIFQQAADVFKFGVSVALALNPNVKINEDLKEKIKKTNGGKNVGQINTIDSTEELRQMIRDLEKKPSENVEIRFEELGNWGLLQVKENLLDDDEYIDWEKIKKSIK